jgi:hypothetical protein
MSLIFIKVVAPRPLFSCFGKMFLIQRKSDLHGHLDNVYDTNHESKLTTGCKYQTWSIYIQLILFTDFFKWIASTSVGIIFSPVNYTEYVLSSDGLYSRCFSYSETGVRAHRGLLCKASYHHVSGAEWEKIISVFENPIQTEREKEPHERTQKKGAP